MENLEVNYMLKLTEQQTKLAEQLLKSIINREPVVEYNELATRIRPPIFWRQVGHEIGEISKLCYKLRLPLLSAKVISRGKGTAGEGFFDLMKELGIDTEGKSEKELFSQELKKIRECSEWYKLAEYLGLDLIFPNTEMSALPEKDHNVINEKNYMISFYKEELKNVNTEYFILDTHKSSVYEDIDFKYYYWEVTRYNQLKEGTLFIYRRPQSSSEIKNQFYFFGTGKIEKIEQINTSLVRGTISKPILFDDPILQEDLQEFEFTYKKRGNSWEHFFNQYGMNKINKTDFINLISSDGHQETIEEIEEKITLFQNQQMQNYRVEDQKSNIKVRGAAQSTFARKVKLIYGYECAITGIHTKDFLTASHIIPWAKDKENRINPANGICLSVLVDRAFDKGYITLSDKYEIILSKKLKEDVLLFKLLKGYEGQKIKYNRSCSPDLIFIKWHRDNIFKK